MAYWIIKSEPAKYSWQKFTEDKRTFWDGVRNYQARNNLRAMKVGDHALFYHSNDGMEIVGVAKVVKEAYQDPTTEDHNWVAVDFVPVKALEKAVTLSEMKADNRLADLGLIKQGRLSVSQVTEEQWKIIIELAKS